MFYTTHRACCVHVGARLVRVSTWTVFGHFLCPYRWSNGAASTLIGQVILLSLVFNVFLLADRPLCIWPKSTYLLVSQLCVWSDMKLVIYTKLCMVGHGRDPLDRVIVRYVFLGSAFWILLSCFSFIYNVLPHCAIKELISDYVTGPSLTENLGWHEVKRPAS